MYQLQVQIEGSSSQLEELKELLHDRGEELAEKAKEYATLGWVAEAEDAQATAGFLIELGRNIHQVQIYTKEIK